MVLENLNWVAVGVAGLVYFIIGALWYTVLFVKPFMRYRVKPGETLESGTPADYLVALLTDAISALVLAILIVLTGTVTLLDGVGLGLVAGVGLASTATLKYTIFNGPPKMLWAIDSGYIVVGFAVMGAILAAWR